MMQPQSIAIIGGTLTGNYGAAAMVASVVLATVDDDDSTIVNLFSYYPDEDALVVTVLPVVVHSARPLDLALRLVPQALLRRVFPRLWNVLPEGGTKSAVRALEASRVLACVAGVSFIDGRRRFLLYNVATLLPALILGVPVVKMSQAMGEFDDPMNRWVARRLLPRLRTSVARGTATQEALAKHVRGLDVRTAPDLAFALPKGGGLVRAADGLEASLQSWHDSGSSPVIGVCPSAVLDGTVPGASHHARVMEAAIRTLLDRGYRVVVVPTAARPDVSSTHNNDLPLLEHLRVRFRAVDDAHVLVVDSVRSFADVLMVVRFCEALVVSRFHAMVAGLTLGVPSLVLGWGHKYRETLRDFGLEDVCRDGASIAEHDVSMLVDDFLRQRHDVARRIRSRLPEVTRSATFQLKLVQR